MIQSKSSWKLEIQKMLQNENELIKVEKLNAIEKCAEFIRWINKIVFFMIFADFVVI